MILEKELQAVSLSTTNKDYYAIWQELLEIAGKISERWIPESTNESDPGIVLLKVLTAIADKLNYNIDKNILEAFMPSASQEESMRKLCEMMGYSMKYYRSATTKVTIAYKNTDESFIDSNSLTSGELILPKFTEFINIDKDVTYVSLEQISFTRQNTLQYVDCIEGTVKICEEENGGIVSINNIDDNYRYYLPIADVAENGIFISNYVEMAAGEDWTRVDNLNAQALNKRCFKFGYDSKEMLPYVQFPEDISALIEDGLIIQYIQTNGINGNISAKTLSTFNTPSDWDVSSGATELNGTGKNHTADEFFVYNTIAATNGADKENLTDAYLNFKKTVGTFDTLVTCRDYMNKIYELTVSTTDTTNLVSNIVVSDIRDDINKAISICSFNEFGITYIDTPIKYTTQRTVTPTGGGNPVAFDETYNAIDNFELILYPFKKIYGLNNKSEYTSSFTYDKTTYNDIVSEISSYKTISHNLVLPAEDVPNYETFADIVAIKNYLKLSARITTTTKVNETEYSYILSNIKKAIYENFNARKLDFGEEIPFDAILKVIESADTRIKNVSLDDPILCTKFLLADNTEYYIASAAELAKLQGEALTNYNNIIKPTYKKIYNKLALRNILAGRLALFDYETEFTPSVTESKSSYALVYPCEDSQILNRPIKYMEPKLELYNIPESEGANSYQLKDNQIVQFRAPNFKTVITYPSYVNYYIKLNGTETVKAIPATFMSLFDYMNANNQANFIAFMNAKCADIQLTALTSAEIASYTEQYGCVFKRTGTYPHFTYSIDNTANQQYIYPLETGTSFSRYFNWIKDQNGANGEKLSGLYRCLGTDQSKPMGKMIDQDKNQYQLFTTWTTRLSNPFTFFYVQETHQNTDETNYEYTADGFGRDAVYNSISANEEYELQPGQSGPSDDEYLCINYTSGTSDVETTAEGNSVINTETAVVNTYYGPGTIIKPNFAIQDSETLSNSKSYSKTSGYYFSELNGSGQPGQPKGMYSIGANEQIEIRKQVETLIYDNTPITGAVYIYFKLNNEELNDNGSITLVKQNESYILKEGEYFWYTDKNQTTLNYFGSGNEIVNYTNADITKPAEATKISTEEILEKGLDVITWKKMTGLVYNKQGEANNFIQVNEYQYITLIDTDTLKYVDLDDNNAQIDNNWKTCYSAKYICDGTEGELPKLAVTDVNWEVRTKLAVNTGAAVKQTLHNEYTEDDPPTGPYCKESISIYAHLPTTEETPGDPNLTITFDENNTSLKTNYTISSTDDLIQTYYDSEENKIDDFMIKVFTYDDIMLLKNEEQEPLMLNNMNQYYTTFTFNGGSENNKFTTLHCALADSTNQFGIIMLYYRSESQTIDNNAFIKLTNDTTPIIFNNYILDTEQWWSGYVTNSNEYRLKANTLNILKITNNCDINIFCGKSTDDVIIFSPLRIVNITDNNYGINNSIINYQRIQDNSGPVAEKQLLDDIRAKDPDFKFFYDAVLDNSLAIDINYLINEKLSDESKWYDYNNINNKFVISEIDADYLDAGITLATSSRKPY